MKLLLIILTVLSSFLTNLETKTLQSDFTVTVAEEVNAPMNFPGEIVMQGGKTMYMYNPDVDELTLSNPDEQELLQANPFLYAKALVDVCNIVEKAGGDNTLITLTPKDQSIGINRFVLKLRTADLMPLSIELKEGKKMTTLKLKEPKFVSAPQKWEITPDKNTFINDMRL